LHRKPGARARENARVRCRAGLSGNSLVPKLVELSRRLEESSIAEYVEFMRNPRRVIWCNFLGGAARGFGFAIGASVLAAVFLYLLSAIISLNVPIIGRFVSEIVKFVEEHRG
jgi:hypothetical protein